MKAIKLLTFSLLIIFYILGACGCMNFNDKYNSEIIEYLESKYDNSFTIKKSVLEFNGNDGEYIHAICKSDEYSNAFNVYCYQNSDLDGKKITIDDSEYVICDDYAEIVFQNSLNSQILQLLGSNFFVRCQVKFSDYFISSSEYKKGMLYCVSNEDILSHITVYIISSSEIDWGLIENKVESFCEKLSAYRQYLYFATTNNSDFTSIEKNYLKNINVFDSYILDCEEIKRVEFSLLKRGEGITKRSVEKE